MNQTNIGEKYGVSQYRFPHCYDLKASAFTLYCDADARTLEFRGKTAAALDGAERAYECLKIEQDIYFILLGDTAAVLDLKEKTAVLSEPGGYVFGSLEKGGKTLCFTDDAMDGTRVRWVFGVGRYTDHAYLSGGKALADWAPGFGETEQAMRCVHIRDGIYLADVRGKAPEGSCAPRGTDRLLLLEDYDHMLAVGCAMGGGNVLVSGYAKI